jgi:predicted GNAT superfamily acetyltransferase
MRGPHVRFCERHGGVILRVYSTSAQCCGATYGAAGVLDGGEHGARLGRRDARSHAACLSIPFLCSR